jgi:peroxiredoxin
MTTHAIARGLKRFALAVTGTLMVCPLWLFGELTPGTPAPDFPKDSIWLNSGPLSLHTELRGKVVLIEFWEYTCINCIRTIPRLKELFRRYQPYGFEIVGVHKGEFDFGTRSENVAQAVRRFQLPYPVIADVKDKIWKLYDSNGWPNSFLVDASGVIRHVHHGESGYGELETGIRQLLKQKQPSLDFSSLPIPADQPVFGPSCGLQSDETFIGYVQGSLWGGEIANSEGFQREQAVVYQPTKKRVKRGFFVEGWWLNRRDSFESVTATSPKAPVSLGITYFARDVYAVLGRSAKKPVDVVVLQDGKPIPREQVGKDVRIDSNGNTALTIDEPRMYYLVTQQDDRTHELQLFPKSAGARVYSFSFGNRCLENFDRL